ncbi:MAG TPA: GspH/FimT family pseudopilin [Burkholderiales bacterium]|nr:GspH/FimT family pseudopilin [Burkholderiales bacterium]
MSVAHRCRVAPSSRGFTLIEILVVLLLISVSVSFVAINVRADDRDLLREEAARLAASLEQAQDEAVFTGASLAWRGAAEGYQYLRRTADGSWTPLDDSLFRPWQLPPAVRLVDVEVAGMKVVAGALVVLSPSALSGPVRVVLAAGSERAAVEVGASTHVFLGDGV